MTSTLAPRGRLRLEVRTAAGDLLAERRARNTVLQNGAQIVAGLFSGAAGAGPIDHVGVGFGREAAALDATALTPPGPDVHIDPAALTSEVKPTDFALALDAANRRVRVSISPVFHPTADLEDVTEAGLLGGGGLYNQVVFEPVNMRVGQDITFFWEVDFPYGN